MSTGRDKPKLTPLGDELQQYLRESGLEEQVEAAGIVPEWEERVGEAISAVTQPVRVSRGVLLVAVRTSAWLMELRLMERDILRKVNEGRGKGRIERIRFVMRGDEDAPEDPRKDPHRRRVPRQPRRG